jgi:hypothetical protein
MNSPRPEVNGTVVVHRDMLTGQLSFEWQGGPVICCSPELIEQADPEVLRLEGDVLTIGPFRARVLTIIKPVPGAPEASFGAGVYAKKIDAG